jgi:glycine dehydrogenase subunit 2
VTFRQARWDEPAVWDLAPPREGAAPPEIPGIPDRMRRKEAVRWPELAELEVVRHYTRLSQMNFGIDTVPYALGSCTMKYNPKVSELLARRPGAADLHPYQPEATGT